MEDILIVGDLRWEMQAQVIRTLDAWSELKKIQQAERNVVKGASLSVAKIFE